VQKPAGELRVPSSDPLRLRPGEGADLGELPDDGVDDERRAGEIVHSGVLGELPDEVGGHLRQLGRRPADQRAKRYLVGVEVVHGLGEPQGLGGEPEGFLQQRGVRRVGCVPTVLPPGDRHAQTRWGRKGHPETAGGGAQLVLETRLCPASALPGLGHESDHWSASSPAFRHGVAISILARENVKRKT
jgi:hypothetical protein